MHLPRGCRRHDPAALLAYPNGHKITLLLEETGLDYTLHPVDITAGQQFRPEFLAISPNNRMPAIVDTAPSDGGEPLSLFESGAILEYLADKSGQFLPREVRARSQVLQWLYWQVGGLGPMAGQNHHFGTYAPEKIPYAIDRYVRETARLYGVLDKRLAQSEFIAGDAYSIADMASYPWIVPYERQGQDLNNFPALKRWFDAIAARPATQRAYALGKDLSAQNPIGTAAANKVLFGLDSQAGKR